MKDQIAPTILLYHSIIRPGETGDRYCLAESRFVEHMEALDRNGVEVLSLAALAAALDGESPLPERCVAITFDDAFADFRRSALPVMEALGFPSTLFVPTGLVDEWRPGQEAPFWTPLQPLMSWDELDEVAGRGVTLGAHSHWHFPMDLLGRADAEFEIHRPRELMQQRLGIVPDTFAYPFGFSTPEVRAELRSAGYARACGVRHASTSQANDRFDLVRALVTKATTAEGLVRWLDGGLRVAPCPERVRTHVYRQVRRARWRLDRPAHPTHQRVEVPS